MDGNAAGDLPPTAPAQDPAQGAPVQGQVAPTLQEQPAPMLPIQPAPSMSAPVEYFPVGALLRHLPKFDGKNMTLQDWTERVRGAVKVCNLTPELRAEVALGTLEGDMRRTVMVRPECERNTLEKIFSLLEGAQGGRAKVVQLRSHFFNRPQREGETLMQYSNALQETLNEIQRRDPEAMGAFREVDRLLRDQFIVGLSNKFLQDKLQEMTRTTADMPFYNIYLAAVEREEEYMPVTVKVVSSTHTTGGKSGPEDSESLRDVVQALRAELKELRLEVSQMKSGSLQPPGMTPAPRATPSRITRVRGLAERGPLCWACRQFGHMARECPLQMKPEPTLNFQPPQ